MPVHIHLNLDKLADTAMVGVRRAAVFLDLGHRSVIEDQSRPLGALESSSDVNFTMEFLPKDIPAEAIANFKKEFSGWVIGGALREMLEHYALYLDKMHHAALLVRQSRGDPEPDAEKKHQEFSRRLGVPDKIATLERRFGIAVPQAEHVKSLYSARNCLTHDLGVITPRRCTHDGKMRISWRSLQFAMSDPETGAEQPLKVGTRVEKDMAIVIRSIEQERLFGPGERLILSRENLKGICFFFAQVLVPETHKCFVTFIEEAGVKVDAEQR